MELLAYSTNLIQKLRGRSVAMSGDGRHLVDLVLSVSCNWTAGTEAAERPIF